MSESCVLKCKSSCRINHSHTAINTTDSGVVGGVGKAVTAMLLLMAITLPGLIADVLYEAAYATDRFMVEIVLDNLLAKLSKYNKENTNKVVGLAFGIGLRKKLVNLLKCTMFQQFPIV